MSIVISQHKSITKILIDGFMYRKDIESFLLATNKKASSISFEINFFNVMVIPLRIIKRIDEVKSRSKIFTNELSLRNYLQELNIDIICNDCFINSEQINKIDYIGIGGSAGSLEKICDIIENLPPSNISIFIVIHQKADKKSLLSNILQNHTKHYKVVDSVSDQKVMPKTIYLSQPNKHMIVAGGYIFLTDSEKMHFAKPSISVLFDSLASEYGQELLCLLVCGYGRDGSDSLKSLKKSGATVLIEDPSECKATPMLDNAILSGSFDAIMPLNDMNSYIKKAIKLDSQIDDKDIEVFLEDIYKIYGYDYRNYQRAHIVRRIHHFYNLVQPKDFDELKELTLNNKLFFKKLFLDISINVTTLFRDHNTFENVRELIIPQLDSFTQVKIWCAGCSTGEEAYSLAIILKETGLWDRSIIYATDINKVVLQKAKNGIYSKGSFDLFSKHYYESGGNKEFDNYFDIYDHFVTVKDSIKEKMLFFEHNLAMDSVINEFQLIFCRNVLIYFDNQLKSKVFKLFDNSLSSHGFLVLGNSEMIDKKLVNFNQFDKKDKIYKKVR